ncbi:MAG: DNA methylase [Clostridia bacterium]|nr:DNA methylase [Clostridia bacterium]
MLRGYRRKEGNGLKKKTYIAIDLKSFYASVECVSRGLDALNTNLVVADETRTQKTICLAVSPSLKAHGIPGRARLFEVEQKVKEVNRQRLKSAPFRRFSGKSHFADELEKDASLELSFIIAPPRMSYYVEISTQIYKTYLKYVAPEDIHVYSIDEVFIDATDYIKAMKISAREFATLMIRDVLKVTGITATAGIGGNLYLCKVAMDIVAKHIPPDKDGVRIAELNEFSYRRLLWSHRPLTDFWRVGRGYAKKLEENGMFTMGDVARCSVGKASDRLNEGLLYKLFGVNAELLIDHAWGWEPCTIADVKAYKPEANSIGSGQVLHCPYDFDKAKLVLKEMTEALVLDLVDKGLKTDQIVLTVGYDTDNLSDEKRMENYSGEITTDFYGRKIPKHAHGTANLKKYTSSTQAITSAVVDLYEGTVNRNFTIRRLYLTATRVLDENARIMGAGEQLDFFTPAEEEEKENAALEKEQKLQRAALDIKKKFGKNALVKGMSLEEGATAIDRNNQIGGHKA